MSCVLSFYFRFINFILYNSLTHQISPTCCVSLLQLHTLTNASICIQYSRKRLNCLLGNTISLFLLNCSLQQILNLDELNTIKKQYNIHIHTSTTEVTLFSFLQYCQQHKAKHCILSAVVKATNYGVTFF